MLKNAFWGGIAAGMLVGIGGTVFLSCENRVAGAVLFSVALICICVMGFYLYTGKIGIFIESPTKKLAAQLPVGLIGNAVGAALMGIASAVIKPSLIEKAQASCGAKLESSLPVGFLAAIFCGVLMYAAVKTYALNGTLIGIIFCIPTFILSGFEHSVADIYYFTVAAMGGGLDRSVVLFILVAVLGNTIGGWLLPILTKLGKGIDKQ